MSYYCHYPRNPSLARAPIWGVVIRASDRPSHVQFIELNPSHDGEQLMRLVSNCLTRSPHTAVTHLLKPLSSVIVCTAGIKLVCSIKNDWEANLLILCQTFEDPYEPASIRVVLDSHERDLFLTEALRDPKLLRYNTTFLIYYNRFNVPLFRSLEGLVGQKVLVVEQRLDKRKVAASLVVLLILSLLLGLLTGISLHRAEVGVAVTAAIFALTTFLQGLVAWFYD